MNTLEIKLENCYGIEKLEKLFDFSRCRAFEIYAPNGSMKSSLARTFDDLAKGRLTTDRIFPDRVSVRHIVDENGVNLPQDSVVVLEPYDGMFENEERHSILLLDRTLQQKYDALNLGINKAEANLLTALRSQSKSKTRDFKNEISIAVMQTGNAFYDAIRRLKPELDDQKDAPFAHLEYERMFNEPVMSVLNDPALKAAIATYIHRYNELLDQSTFCKKGVFDYYNASTIAKQLADHGFFEAKHSVNLNNGETKVITTKKELEDLIAQEMDQISNDAALKKTFDAIRAKLIKNRDVREFQEYVTEHEEILPELDNVAVFRQKVLKSYLKENIALYDDLLTKYEAARQGHREIQIEAAKQETQWERAIKTFNSRFIVPFKLTIANKIAVQTGEESILKLGFTFEDGRGSAVVEKPLLIEVLSMGEKKALYILNIIFEVEARKITSQQTLFIVDDIADSFDYKNKYAIIEYLREISTESNFRQIILTHNFDFFRTVHGRFIPYTHCLMASKGKFGMQLDKAEGIENIFANKNGWKDHFLMILRKGSAVFASCVISLNIHREIRTLIMRRSRHSSIGKAIRPLLPKIN